MQFPFGCWNLGNNSSIAQNTPASNGGWNIGEFWTSTGTSAVGNVWPTQWPDGTTIPAISNATFTIDAAGALVADVQNVDQALGEFSEVYKDKTLTLTKTTGAGPAVVGNVATGVSYNQLADYTFSWTNNGSAVVNNIYIFVPIKLTYIWGQDVTIGYACITVQPTYQG